MHAFFEAVATMLLSKQSSVHAAKVVLIHIHTHTHCLGIQLQEILSQRTEEGIHVGFLHLKF